MDRGSAACRVCAKGHINDMPFMDVLSVDASKHFQWNQPPLPFDAFNTIMYQLWLRRHTVRYVRMQ